MIIAIIDHDFHTLFVEDINDEILEGQYGGNEQLYIEQNYRLDNYSWDYIIETDYFSQMDKTPVEIDFDNLKK